MRIHSPMPATSIAAAWTQTGAHCWGRGLEGQIGDGARENRPAPVPIWDGNPFRDISGGNTHGCGLAIDNAAYGWGFNGAGQLGDGTKEDRLTPTAVLGSAAP